LRVGRAGALVNLKGEGRKVLSIPEYRPSPRPPSLPGKPLRQPCVSQMGPVWVVWVAPFLCISPQPLLSETTESSCWAVGSVCTIVYVHEP
jgi:hypothetical protein